MNCVFHSVYLPSSPVNTTGRPMPRGGTLSAADQLHQRIVLLLHDFRESFILCISTM